MTRYRPMPEYPAYRLANMADCASPDSPDSPGAKLLLGVADAVRELVEFNEFELDEPDDSIFVIADSAPNTYTQARWREFVDLCAYQEDLDEIGGSQGDMTQDAGAALYMIAQRLAWAMLQDNEDDGTENDDEED